MDIGRWSHVKQNRSYASPCVQGLRVGSKQCPKEESQWLALHSPIVILRFSTHLFEATRRITIIMVQHVTTEGTSDVVPTPDLASLMLTAMSLGKLY
jgi:hypothetical protein